MEKLSKEHHGSIHFSRLKNLRRENAGKGPSETVLLSPGKHKVLVLFPIHLSTVDNIQA